MNDFLDDLLYSECYGAFRTNKEKVMHAKHAICLRRIVDMFEDSEIDSDKIKNLNYLIEKANKIKNELIEGKDNG